jgi:hypothetical protein
VNLIYDVSRILCRLQAVHLARPIRQDVAASNRQLEVLVVEELLEDFARADHHSLQRKRILFLPFFEF